MKTRGKRQPKFIVAAQKLRADIEAHKPQALPSYHMLCKQYNVSLKTIMRAVAILRDEGLVRIVHGAGIFVTQSHGAADGSAPAAQTNVSARNLADKIKSGLADGIYRYGYPLPKFNFFVLSENVSASTVSAAFKILKAEKCIHKLGVQWYAGQKQTTGPKVSSYRGNGDYPDEVLILVPTYQAWTDFCKKTRFRPFFSELVSVLNQFGAKFTIGIKDTAQPFPDIPKGQDGISHYIGQLGDRYLGALIVAPAYIFEDIQQWMEMLIAFSKPVVWYDLDNSAPAFDRRAVESDLFYRCYTNEPDLARLVIDHLYQQGHRRIGMPRTTRPQYKTWLNARITHLNSALQDYAKPPKLIVRDQHEKIWRDPYLDKYEHPQIIERILGIARSITPDAPRRRKGTPAHTDSTAAHLSAMPSLEGLINHDHVTALIAPNDWLAVIYYHWLIHAGFRIPQDISLISFDNILLLQDYPLTTVDPNIEYLGYAAAHIFTRAIPDAADENGNIGSKPWISDKGSTAKRSKAGTGKKQSG